MARASRPSLLLDLNPSSPCADSARSLCFLNPERKTMKKQPGAAPSKLDSPSVLNTALFWVCLSLLVLVPLVFVVSVHRTYAAPKLAILLVGASILAPLAGLAALEAARNGSELARLFIPAHFVLVTLYFASVTVSTFFGLDPIASLFGFFHNQMGLVPQLCFLTSFIALTFGINNDETRLHKLLWAMAITGFLASAYAVIQFFGYDPFLHASLYTYRSEEGDVRRVIGTLGHADYLGNFLMYTTPLGVALGIAARGRARLLALIASGVSVAAIAMSGTRGAWAGIVAAAMAVCFLEVKTGKRIWQGMTRRVLFRRAALVLVIIAASAGAMSLSPAARGVAIRARSLVTEGFTGSGRTLLWRDSIKMIPAFALVGSGPDSFRMAFLGYKSKELAQLTGFNNESSHNSYLDAAISYGLPGALLYIGVIASAFGLLLRARRRAISPQLKVVVTGLLASLVAATAHNFFIFDQIPTGLYFFALIGLAQVVSNLTEASNGSRAAPRTKSNSVKPPGAASAGPSFKAFGWAVAVVGGALVVAAVWYAAGALRADLELNHALASADRGDLDRVIEHGARAASGPEPTGDHDLMVARALALCSSRLEASLNAARQSGGDNQQIALALDRAARLAVTYAERSVEHTFTPDLSYLFLALNAKATGDMVKMRQSATEAVRWDPNNFRALILLAQAHIADGNREQAAREAEFALDLNPFSMEAASALARAHGEDPTTPKVRAQMHNSRPNLKHSVEDLIEIARDFSQKGKWRRARFKLLLAIGRAEGPCSDCHRELAIVYEKMDRYPEAIAEWETFIEQAPERASAERIKERIDALKRKPIPNSRVNP